MNIKVRERERECICVSVCLLERHWERACDGGWVREKHEKELKVDKISELKNMKQNSFKINIS